MKKNELVNIIVELVRREVKKEVKRIFINESTSMKLSAAIPKIKSNKVVSTKKILQKPKKKYVEYTKNQSLNKVLNETVGGVPQGEGGYETMGGGIYDSSKVNEILVRETGLGNSESVKEKKREIAAVDSIKKAGVSVDQVPDHVTNALTRDYSAVMKAIDQKKGGGNSFRP